MYAVELYALLQPDYKKSSLVAKKYSVSPTGG